MPTVSFTNAVGDTTGGGATASATGGVDAVNVTTPGVHYTQPTVGFTGTNTSPAAATATGAVDAINVTTAGGGYTSPVLTLTGGGGTGVVATPTGSVDSLTIPVGGGGAGYTAINPTVTITAPPCSINGTTCVQATATATAASGAVTSIVINIAGAGYTAAPTVSVTDTPTPTTLATVNATISVTSVSLTNGGSAFTSAPSVTITGGSPNAVASATISVTAVTVTSAGAGYTVAPTVAITDSGVGATLAVASATLKVTAINVTAAGANYTLAPTVSFAGGTATSTLSIAAITLVNPGSGYLITPVVNFTGGGSGANATSNLKVSAITLTSPGTGYTSAPTVGFTGGGGSGASATATIASTGLTLINGGSGYTAAPLVTIADSGGGTGGGALANATLSLTNLTLTGGGTGYTAVPAVTFSDPTGIGATATASLAGPANSFSVPTLAAAQPNIFATTQDQIIIPEPGFPAANGLGGPNYVRIQDNYVNAWFGNGVGGLTLTSGGANYQGDPLVVIAAPTCAPLGTPTCYAATATASVSGGVGRIDLTNPGSLYIAVPTVTIGAPPAGGVQATARATFNRATGKVTAIIVTNPGSGYLTAPAVTISAPPGDGIPALARAVLYGPVASLTLVNGGAGYTSAPAISFVRAPGDTTGAGAAATAQSMHLMPKAIQELFTLDYGRMNATLGVELPFTNFFVQTTIPYGYIDPPTELLKDGDIQIWKITHNGVDTHFVHFHLFSVQVLNRVGWDGMIKPPDPNEMAWKDTVRMNPLEDIIVAFKPMKQTLPWQIPNSVRPMDVTSPIGASTPANTMGFSNVDPTNEPANVTNQLVNFGQEYVVHCHILGHEENDMMRPMLLAVKPAAPSTLVATTVATSRAVTLTWKDNSLNETGFTVQRSIDGIGWVDVSTTVPAMPGIGGTVSFKDQTVARLTPYLYRVIANNMVGYDQTYAAPAVGYPHFSYDSQPSNQVLVTTNGSASTAALTSDPLIFASSFADGLVRFNQVVGNVMVAPQAGMGGAAQGMAATIDGGQAAYVVDTSPKNETIYHANFYFNPNWTATGASPITIFNALDQSNNSAFAIQYMRNDQENEDHTFLVRASALLGGTMVNSPWYAITNETHQLEIAWYSNSAAHVNLYVDNQLAGSLSGNTTASVVVKAYLGASAGLSSDASGTLYFGEFTSVRLNDIHFDLSLPVVNN